MTDCPNGEMRDQLPELLHGRLGAGERVLVETHVAGCADCRAELALLGTLRGTMHRVPAVNVGSIVAAIPAYAPAAAAPMRRAGRWGGLRAAAAIAAVAIGGASYAIVRDARPVELPPATVVARGDAPVAGTGEPATPPAGGAAIARPVTPVRELALGGGTSDLSDGELAELLAELETMDALPAADVESNSLVPATALPNSEGA